MHAGQPAGHTASGGELPVLLRLLRPGPAIAQGRGDAAGSAEEERPVELQRLPPRTRREGYPAGATNQTADVEYDVRDLECVL